MRFYYDERTDVLSATPGTQDEIDDLKFKRGAGHLLQIQFGSSPDGSNPVSINSAPVFTARQLTTPSIEAVIKSDGLYEQDPPLARVTSFSWNATTSTYDGTLVTNTNTMNAALGHDGYGDGTTFTNSGDVVTLTDGTELADNDPCQVTTTDTLPSGLSVSTDYWWDEDNNKFLDGPDGTVITLADSGTGTHTVIRNPDDTNDIASLTNCIFDLQWKESGDTYFKKPRHHISCTVFHDGANGNESTDVIVPTTLGAVLRDGSLDMTGDFDAGSNSVLNVSDIEIEEAADHTTTPSAGNGIIWVKSDTPNTLYFTDDAGTDFILNGPKADGQYKTERIPIADFNATAGSPTWDTAKTYVDQPGWLLATSEAIQAVWKIPEDCDVTAALMGKIIWTSDQTSGTFKLQGGASFYAATEAITTPSATAEDQTATADAILYESGAIALGTPSALDWASILVSRNATGDTMTGDAKILGFAIQYKVDIDGSTLWT